MLEQRAAERERALQQEARSGVPNTEAGTFSN